jgi:hypothetical protein
MVQERKSNRDKILEALSKGHLSSKQINALIPAHIETIKKIRIQLVKDGLIEQVGEQMGEKGVGLEKIWALKNTKPKAVNAFDWRNWETQAHFSKRELAYSNRHNDMKEKRVIVYSRA